MSQINQSPVESFIEALKPHLVVDLPMKNLLEKLREQVKPLEYTLDDLKDAYNAGYTDAQANHINDADNYVNELNYIRDTSKETI